MIRTILSFVIFSTGALFAQKRDYPIQPVGATRWEKEEELSHELNDAGHLYEAAFAHYNATGKKNLLNIALKNADL